MSNGAYSPDKAAAHPDRLRALRAGAYPYPVHLHLIIADLCNLACPGCAYRMPGYSSNEHFGVVDPVTHAVNNNPARFLPTATVKRVLDDCIAMGTRAVEFTGGGEPTLHPDARELLTYAQVRGLDTALITNGLLLDTRDLFDAAVRTQWCRISIDAATPETYGRVRPGLGGGNGGNLDRVLDALTTLRKLRDAKGTLCVIGAGFVVQKENWHEIHEAVRLFKDAGADNVRISGLFSPEGDRYHTEHYEAAAALERRAVAEFDGKDGFRVYGRFAEKVDDLHGAPAYPTCHYQRLTTYLGGDGNVYRCCVTSYNRQGFLGSIGSHGGSLRALWDAPETRALLDGFDARSCARCQFNDRNRAIDALLRAPTLPAPPSDLVHPGFV
jgi:MoaA/NifB/PqqE/SkfB family radical SAM enzyme